MITNRYLDGSYSPVNSGDRFWTAQYYYSSGTMKVSTIKAPIEVVIGDDGYTKNIPGHKGRKLPSYYYGNLFTTKEKAEAYLQEQMDEHLESIISRLETVVKTIQSACEKAPMLRATSKFNDLKKAFQDYAQVL